MFYKLYLVRKGMKNLVGSYSHGADCDRAAYALANDMWREGFTSIRVPAVEGWIEVKVTLL